ncbi:right-handed parallel beta-helix repeat-containing protein [Halomicroarcula sp. GCM10025894]|uniref:right-handed parallel beta-helix repeat-containing protein n=1 Tax=Halomicroarcula sp. GCM10025894 TaxID=3252673 RepID=UPI003608970C
MSVTQIQAAARGACRGALTAGQEVSVSQIQAAAAGASQGTVVQIQQVQVVQVQTVAQSAASGAISQFQRASVTQIQSAAKGAGEGGLSLIQRQQVTVEQLQVQTERAAADAAGTAAEINIDNAQTIEVYATGAVESDRPDDGDEDGLRSLFASADDDGIFLANPNDAAVTVTLTGGENPQTVTLAAGESTTVDLDPGTYTLTAETSEGDTVQIAGRDELALSVGAAVQSLTATVDNRTLTVGNPNDDRVRVTVSADGDTVAQFEVPRNFEASQQLEPGNYTLTAETTDGRSVPIDGSDQATVTVAGPPTETPTDTPTETPTGTTTETPTATATQQPTEPVDLSAAVDGQNVSLENPSNTSVNVTAVPENGTNQSVAVPAGETVTETFEPGNYTVTGDAGDRTVLLNGAESTTITVESTAVSPVIDSCRTISEPGSYELGGDLSSDQPLSSCLVITSSDVTIDGNGNTIQGAQAETDVGGESTGISVPSESRAENITVRNVEVRGWEWGISTLPTFDAGVELTVEDSVVANNDQGLRFTESDEASLSNLTIEENGDGMSALEGATELRDSVVRNNGQNGVSAGQANDMTLTNVRVTGNGGTGVIVSNEGQTGRLQDVVVTDNGGAGVAVGSDTSAQIVDSRIEGNAVGVNTTPETGPAVDVSIQDSAIQANSGVEIDVQGQSIDATGLQLAETTTVGIDAQGVTLDAVEQGALAPVDNGTLAGPGLNVSTLEGSVQATISTDTAANATLWRYDGSAWAPVADSTSADGGVTAQLTEVGLYAPVVPEALTPTATATPTETPTETETPTPTETETPTPTEAETPTPTETETPTPTEAETPTPTETETPTPTEAETPTPTEAETPTPTETETPTETPEPTPEPTPESTPEPTPEPTPESTPEPEPEPEPDDEDTPLETLSALLPSHSTGAWVTRYPSSVRSTSSTA